MDKIVIRGGLPLSGAIPIAGAKNAALPLMAASLLDRRDAGAGQPADLADIKTMADLLAQHGVAVGPGGAGTRPDESARVLELSAPAHHLDHRALRSRAQDARLVPGAGAAARALRRGEGVAARRLRDRHAAGRSAHQGPGAPRRRGRAHGRLYRGARAEGAERRRDRLPQRLGRRHRESADGGGARRGRDHARSMPRASPRSPTSPTASTRWARRSRASAPTG